MRPMSSGDRHHQRDRQTQGVRAGDDQHGRHPFDHFHIKADGNRPGDGGQRGHSQRDVEQPAGGSVASTWVFDLLRCA